MSDETESILSDHEWDLIESAQAKLEAGNDDLTHDEEAALEKAIEAGEIEIEHED